LRAQPVAPIAAPIEPPAYNGAVTERDLNGRVRKMRLSPVKQESGLPNYEMEISERDLNGRVARMRFNPLKGPV
jgi:hypothetical protein